jgi:catalase
VHCLAVEEVWHIERAALVTAAGEGATAVERQGVADLLLHIAQQRIPFRGVRAKG